jgi:hypothetical protein
MLENYGEDQLGRLYEDEEVLHGVKGERNILQTIKGRKVNRIGHIVRTNCLVKHVTEGRIEGKRT